MEWRKVREKESKVQVKSNINHWLTKYGTWERKMKQIITMYFRT